MKKIFFNNQFVSDDEVTISMYDKGYQFGDGVYEVIRFYNKKFFKLEEHLVRYQNSINKLDINYDLDFKKLKEVFEQLMKLNDIQDGYIYTQITRGVAPRNHLYNKDELNPQFIAYVEPASRPIETMNTGVKAILLEDERWLMCDVKSLNLIGSVLAKNKAKKLGASDAILHRGDYVTEASAANVFVVKDNVLYTHPVNNLILNGVTRIAILEIAQELQLKVLEESVTVDFLLTSDEIFTSGTVAEITPIVEIKDKGLVGDGKLGRITKLIQDSFTNKINNL